MMEVTEPSERLFAERKELRKGLSTGTYAAACAKAAALFLLGERREKVKVWLPCGQEREVAATVCLKGDYAEALAVKNAGDDPDVTNGIEIGARVWLRKGKQSIFIRGGEGVGVATKPGLRVKVGEWAINPVPRRQIEVNLKEILPSDFFAEVEVFVPRGREVAKHTYNPILGIEGGISILGTTGLVLPMSHQAFQETVYLHLKQCFLLGRKKICLVPGNYGYAKALELGFAKEEIVKISSLVGFALEACAEFGAERVFLVGQVGKMVKIAGGIFDTHHLVADARREILFAHLVRAGLPVPFWSKVWEARTAEEVALHIASWEGATEFWQYLAREISHRAEERVQRAFRVESIVFSLHLGVLGRG
jgi:cobalt-precorrin-5B (C1)-methyltransferase